MSRLPFRREIVRGVGLAALLLAGLFVGVAVHRSTTAESRAETIPVPIVPAFAPPQLGTQAQPVEPENVGAPIRSVRPSDPMVPPPPPLKVRSAAGKPAIPRTAAPAVRTVIVEAEESLEPEAEEIAEPAPSDDKTAAAAALERGPSPNVSDAAIETSAQPGKNSSQSRGARWVKSLGRRLRILPRPEK